MAQLTSGPKRGKRYLFQCDNKQLKRILITLWSIAIIIEVLVATETWICIRLSSDYLNEAFSATCTVAVLGNAILSILFGVYDKKTLGVPFQDVLNHSKIGSEQRFTIEVLTTSIVVAIVWYVLGCYNLLFAVLIQNVFLLLFSCDDLWNFLSDELRSLSSDQCTQCIARYEKDGMYAIGGYYFDYDHAMKYAELNILSEEITVFIHVDIQSGDGFQIKFNRK